MAGHRGKPHPTRRLWEEDEALRRRVAQTLHGPVKNTLLFAYYEIQSALDECESGDSPIAKRLANLQAILDDLAQSHIDPAIHDAYPLIIQLGLLPALRSLINSPAHRGLNVQLHADAHIERLDDPMENRIPLLVRLSLYRAVESALKLMGESRIDGEQPPPVTSRGNDVHAAVEAVTVTIDLEGEPHNPGAIQLVMAATESAPPTHGHAPCKPHPWADDTLARAEFMGATGEIATVHPRTTLLRVTMPWDTIERS